jgi:predicted nuclease of restriction endonuclease-like (RecB) superfamily
LKDPYIFDFLTLGDKAKEKNLERALLERIKNFLLELGAGFAFIGS